MPDSVEKFDVVHSSGGVTVEPHFCREWDEDGGCYGTNPEHGLSWAEACQSAADWHRAQAEQWAARARTETPKEGENG